MLFDWYWLGCCCCYLKGDDADCKSSLVELDDLEAGFRLDICFRSNEGKAYAFDELSFFIV